MEALTCLVATTVAVVLLRKPLAKAPWAFYLAALLLSVAFYSGALTQTGSAANAVLVPLMRRCQLAFCLLAVVMYIGVLPIGSKWRAELVPIRGTLAIIAAILALCHVALYGGSYLARIGIAGSGLNAATYAALALAVVLVVLLAALSVTSVRKVRETMTPGRWKALQRMAYVFFPLIGLHALLMIGPAALSGGPTAANALVYLAVVLLWAGLRIARFASDARRTRQQA